MKFPVMLFVYGSLKRNCYNNSFLKGCEFIANATIGNFTLYDVGSYPVAVQREGETIKGEVFKVPEGQFQCIYDMERGAGYRLISLYNNLMIFYFRQEDFEQLPYKKKIGATWNENMVHVGLSSES